MLHSDIKTTPRYFLTENFVGASGPEGSDLFGCQEIRWVGLGLLLLIFDKLIIILLFY